MHADAHRLDHVEVRMRFPARAVASRRGGNSSPVNYGLLIADMDPAHPDIVLVSGKVSSLPGSSGTSYTFAQGTAGNRPTFNAGNAAFNGKPTIDYAGVPGSVAHYLASTTPLAFGGAAKAVIILVCRITATSIGVLVESSPDANGPNGAVTIYNNNTTLDMFFKANGVTPDMSHNFGAINTKRYLDARFDLGVPNAGGIVLHSPPGTNRALSGGGTFAGDVISTQTWYVGVRGGSPNEFPFVGEIARMLVYSGDVDSAGLYTDLLQPEYG
jgi:hypothetical protein